MQLSETLLTNETITKHTFEVVYQGIPHQISQYENIYDMVHDVLAQLGNHEPTIGDIDDLIVFYLHKVYNFYAGLADKYPDYLWHRKYEEVKEFILAGNAVMMIDEHNDLIAFAKVEPYIGMDNQPYVELGSLESAWPKCGLGTKAAQACLYKVASKFPTYIPIAVINDENVPSMKLFAHLGAVKMDWPAGVPLSPPKDNGDPIAESCYDLAPAIANLGII